MLLSLMRPGPGFPITGSAAGVPDAPGAAAPSSPGGSGSRTLGSSSASASSASPPPSAARPSGARPEARRTLSPGGQEDGDQTTQHKCSKHVKPAWMSMIRMMVLKCDRYDDV